MSGKVAKAGAFKTTKWMTMMEYMAMGSGRGLQL
jgi:hypothetical protein